MKLIDYIARDYGHEIRLRRLEGETYAELADDFGLSVNSINTLCKRLGVAGGRRSLGLPRRPALGRKGKRAEQRREQTIKMREAGKTYQEIGNELGITRERVRQYLCDDRKDLTGSLPSIKDLPQTCKNCNAEFYRGTKRQFCSIRCSSEAKPARIRDSKGPIVYERYLAGESWAAIGRAMFPEHTQPGPYAQLLAKRYAEKNDLPRPYRTQRATQTPAAEVGQ